MKLQYCNGCRHVHVFNAAHPMAWLGLRATLHNSCGKVGMGWRVVQSCPAT